MFVAYKAQQKDFDFLKTIGRAFASIFIVGIFFNDEQHQPTLLAATILFTLLELTIQLFEIIEENEIWKKFENGTLALKIIFIALFLQKIRPETTIGVSEHDEIYLKMTMADLNTFPEKSIILTSDSIYQEIVHLTLDSNFRQDLILIRKLTAYGLRSTH